MVMFFVKDNNRKYNWLTRSNWLEVTLLPSRLFTDLVYYGFKRYQYAFLIDLGKTLNKARIPQQWRELSRCLSLVTRLSCQKASGSPGYEGTSSRFEGAFIFIRGKVHELQIGEDLSKSIRCHHLTMWMKPLQLALLYSSHFSFKTIETRFLYSAVGTQEWKCFAIGQWGKLCWLFLLLLFCTTWLKCCSKPLVTAHHLSTEKSRWFDALGRHTFLTRLLCAWPFVSLSPEHVMHTQIHSFSVWCCLRKQAPIRVFPRDFDSFTAAEESGSMFTLQENTRYWWELDWVLC